MAFIVFPLLSFKTISAPTFVREIEEKPILEILLGKELSASSFTKRTKLSGSIFEVGKPFSVVSIVMIQSVKSIVEFVLL